LPMSLRVAICGILGNSALFQSLEGLDLQYGCAAVLELSMPREVFCVEKLARDV
jgi:hypothetical protein